MKKLLQILAVSSLILIGGFQNKAFAQCENNNTVTQTFPAPTTVGKSVGGQICVFPGEAFRLTDLQAGSTYRISSCASDPGLDTRLTIYPAAGGDALGFNDDYCGVFSRLDYKAATGDSIDILLDAAGPNNTCLHNEDFCGSIVITLISVSGNPEYCLPTYNAPTGTTLGHYIDGVILEGINNTNSGAKDGVDYTFYSNLYTDLNVNTNYSVTINNNPDSTARITAWIDYNQDTEFSDDERLGQIILLSGATGHINFKTPAHVPAGLTRMRVRMMDSIPGIAPVPGDTIFMNPCNPGFYGETEDYVIKFPTDPPGDSDSLNFNTQCGLDIDIQDNACENKTQASVNVTGLGSLGDTHLFVSASIIIEHPNAEDLDIFLESPDGQHIELSTDNGGFLGANYGDNSNDSCNNVARFIMSASVSIKDVPAPFIGSFVPEGDLNILNNGSTNPNGIWRLLVCDDNAGDVGKIRYFGVSFKKNLPPSCATLFTPESGAINVDTSQTLSWSPGEGEAPLGYNVYFGTDSNPPLVSSNQVGTSYEPGALLEGTTYYYQVIPVNLGGEASGCQVDSFTTIPPIPLPGCVQNVSPADESINVSVNTNITWNSGTGPLSGFDVLFGTDPENLSVVAEDLTDSTYSVGYALEYETTYYYLIVPKNAKGSPDCPLIKFTTEEGPRNGIYMQDGIIAACDTLFYDSGGPNKDYKNNETYVLTIVPATPYSVVSVTFNDFSAEEGLYEGLAVINGPVVSLDTLGILTGTINAPVKFTSTAPGGELTFVFHSDEFVTAPGWNAQFKCLPAVPCATTYAPEDLSTNISTDTTLSWLPGVIGDPNDPFPPFIPFVYDVYFGTDSSNLSLVSSNQYEITYNPGTLLPGTKYFWKVVPKTPVGTETEPDTSVAPGCEILSFTTGVPCATNLAPADLSLNIEFDSVLTWTAPGVGDPNDPFPPFYPFTYDVYLGSDPNSLLLVSDNQSETTFNPGTLSSSTTYYWNVIPSLNGIEAQGCSPISFTTRDLVYPNCAVSLKPAAGDSLLCRDLTITWESDSESPASSYNVYFDSGNGLELVSGGQTETFYKPGILDANTSYSYKIVPINGDGLQENCDTVSFKTGTCLSYCEAGTTEKECREHIANVTLGDDINNTSECPSDSSGYSDFTNLFGKMYIGVEMPLEVTSGDSLITDSTSAWIDWNQDGDFYDEGESIVLSGQPFGPYKATIIPPVDAYTGITRMRIRITDLSEDTLGPCGFTKHGETEDYTIQLFDTPECPYPTNIAVENITMNSADLTWTENPNAIQYFIRYKKSSDADTVSSWSNPIVIDAPISNQSFTGLEPCADYIAQIGTVCEAGKQPFYSLKQKFRTHCQECNSGDIAETESCGLDENGGCDAASPAYQSINCGETICGSSFRQNNQVDADWYNFSVTDENVHTFKVNAEFAGTISIIDIQDCSDYTVIDTDNFTENTELSLDVNLPAGNYAVVISPFNSGKDFACGDRNLYKLNFYQVPTSINAIESVCIADGAFNLTASPEGGVWSGTGITDAETGTFDPSVSGTGTFTVTYKLTNNTCVKESSFDVVVIDILPSPAAISGSDTLCIDPENNVYSIDPVQGADQYSWSINPANAGSINGNNNSVTIDWDNSYVGTAVISVTADNKCGNSPSSELSVTILNSLPNAPSKPIGSDSLCVGSAPTQYSIDSLTGATEYVWSISPSAAGSISGSGSTSEVTWNSGFIGNASITVYGKNDCGQSPVSESLTVLVSDKPANPGAITGNATSCSGTENYAVSASANTQFNWSLSPSNSGTINGTGNAISITWTSGYLGSVTLSVEAENYCGKSSESKLDINVSKTLTAAPSTPSGPDSLCINSPNSDFTVTSYTGAAQYVWSINPAQAGTISGSGTTATVDWNNSFAGNASISVIAKNDCGQSPSSTIKVVKVIDVPSNPGNIQGNATSCNNAENYTVSSVGTAKLNWSISPANAGFVTGTGNSINVNWASGFTGNATISVQAETSCGKSTVSTKTVKVVNKLIVAPSQPSGSETLCKDAPNNQYTIGTVTGADEYVWNITPAQAGTISGTGTTATVDWSSSYVGSVTITAAAKNDCGQGPLSMAKTINISDVPSAPGAIQGTLSTCKGSESYFTSGSGSANLAWSLNPANAGTISGSGNSITVTWASGYNGNVTLSVQPENNCGKGSSTSITIKVVANQPVDFVGLAAKYCTTDQPATLTGIPVGGYFTITGNNGINGNIFDPSKAGKGKYTITYFNTVNGCPGNISQDVEVVNGPNVTIGTIPNACSNGQAVSLSGTPSGGIFSGPGVTGNQFNPKAVKPGSVTISYLVNDPQNTCSGEAKTTFTVFPAPVTSIVPEKTTACVNSKPISLTGIPAPGTFSGPGVSGNGLNPSVAGVGIHTVKYVVSNGTCSDSSTVQITVTAAPQLSIAKLPDSLCTGDGSVLLTSNPAGAIFSGPGVTGNTFNPKAAGAGKHTITASLSENGCTSASSATIKVNHSPVAYFNMSAPDYTVTMTNSSQYADSYFWDFGDQATSTAANPTHTYAKSGFYTVMLIAKNASCGGDTLRQNLDITVGIGSIDGVELLQLFPNPTSGNVNLQFNSVKNQSFTITINDATGRLIEAETIRNYVGKFNRTFDLSDKSKGIYFFTIRSENGTTNFRVVKD